MCKWGFFYVGFISFRPLPPQREYSEWVVKARRTIVAVLEDLPSFKPPLDHLLELLPRLQARYYSISSSAKVGALHFDL